MASQTITEVLQEHAGNKDLNTASPAHIMRSQTDLGADGIVRPLDERIIATAVDALESGQTHYVDVPGIAPLRGAVAEFLSASFGAAYEQGNIVITAGIQESRFLSIQMIGAQFENIGVPDVVHPGVRKALGTRKRNVISLAVDAHAGYLPSVETIAAAVAGGCRLLFLESPSRLSGAVYTAEQVAAISQIVTENDAAVIWDQGLSLWVDGYNSLASHDSEAASVATIGEAWPGMGLASWFIGYIAAPEAWVPPMQSQKQIQSICTSTASQYGALEAGNLYAAEGNLQLASLQRLRSGLPQLASDASLELVRGGAANIIALHAPSSAATTLSKLQAAGYSAADGALFGAPDVIRLNVTNSTADALRALA